MAERKQRKSEGKREIVGEREREAAASAPASLRETERPAERVREIEREREGIGVCSGGGVAGAAGDGKRAREGRVSRRGRGKEIEREGKKSGFSGGEGEGIKWVLATVLRPLIHFLRRPLTAAPSSCTKTKISSSYKSLFCS
ncbi:hypothetical protein MRB53_030938 [Persea americana]|uniref:Uncharacterized protein n=1 Tax=Persea americana TaxID=3435 RepID=A0ACC2KN60_PERAE|nr:hypothetical protein MRB53_030938 [Persea americana]